MIPGREGRARCGLARCGPAGCGLARHGRAREARQARSVPVSWRQFIHPARLASWAGLRRLYYWAELRRLATRTAGASQQRAAGAVAVPAAAPRSDRPLTTVS